VPQGEDQELTLALRRSAIRDHAPDHLALVHQLEGSVDALGARLEGHTMAAARIVDSLLEAVARIEPILREHAPEAEARRRLSDAAAAAMKQAGLYGMWIPRAYGGLEVDPMTGVRIFEEVARIDSAAAWVLQISVGGSIFPAFFDERGAGEIYGDGNAHIAAAFFPPAEAVAQDGGFRVEARTPFTSGCHHCEWFLGLARVVEDGKPRMREDGSPETWIFGIPARDFEIIENWNTVGMRGSGSHDVAIHEVFVPRHRAAPLLAPERRTRATKGFEGPLYRCTVWPAVSALAAVALGIARAAIDDLLALVQRKTPAYMPSPLRQRAMAQFQAGQAEAKLGAARAYLDESLREAWENAVAGHFITSPQKWKVQLASVHAAQAAAEVVQLVHAAAGTSGIREEHPFERHFRDAHVVTQHAYISASRYESVGRCRFGLESDWGFFEY
jgi:alkylation response protein AidB-like acyl-CoA dehydrogenase